MIHRMKMLNRLIEKIMQDFLKKIDEGKQEAQRPHRSPEHNEWSINATLSNQIQQEVQGPHPSPVQHYEAITLIKSALSGIKYKIP